MTSGGESNFELEVRDDTIMVRFADTSFCVLYWKPTENSALMPTGFSKDVDATPGQIGAFLSVASRLATEKARAVDWTK